MPRQYSSQNTFQNGQIDERLYSRVDTQIYRNAAKEITNWLPVVQGGVRRRPGSKNIDELVGETRGEIFRFGRTETYLLLFSNGRLDIYSLAGAVLATFTGQPWTATTMWQFSFDQDGNYFWLTHESFFREIQRTGLNSFTINDFAFQTRFDGGETYQPYTKFVDETVTLNPSGVTGAISIVASDDVFDAQHVGARFKIRDGEVEIDTVTDAQNATATVKSDINEYLDAFPLATQNGSTEVVVQAFEHEMDVGDVFELIGVTAVGGLALADVSGSRTVKQVLDRNRFIFDADAPATDSEDGGGTEVWIQTHAATRKWKEPLFSTYRGWPRAIAIHQNRMWLGGSPVAIDALVGSETFNYRSFYLGEGADSDGLRLAAQAGGNAIRQLMSNGDLMIFGETKETFVPALRDSITTQTNGRVEDAKTFHGISYVRPAMYDATLLFVDGLGHNLWQLDYDGQKRGYVSSPVSSLEPDALYHPRHVTLFEGADDDTTPFLIYTNENGTAAVFRSQQAEQAAGWYILETEGEFHSFIGAGERLFCTTKRTRNGVDYYFLEEFDFDRIVKMDCSVNVVSGGGDITAWTGLGDLADLEVDVIDGDQNYIGRYTVSSAGEITTDTAVDEIWAGIPFTATIETLPAVVETPKGDTKGQIRTIGEVIVDLVATPFIEVEDHALHNRSQLDVFGSLTPLTGEFEFRYRGNHDRRPTVTILAQYPYDALVNGLRMEVDYV